MNKKRRDELDAYYTPGEIALEMALRLNPRHGSRILDPMCGDGRLLKTLRKVYSDRKLKFVGFDIDDEAISRCKEWSAEEDVFEERTIFSWLGDNNFGCDLIIMNPCFHIAERSHAMMKALDLFNKGIMYVPFCEENPEVMPYSFKKFELHEYSREHLKMLFDCDIKYRQGTIYWEKNT